MDDLNSKQNNRISEKHVCKYDYDYTEQGYFESPFGYKCTKECIQEYIGSQKQFIELIKARIKIFDSLKIFEDGTVPYFIFSDVCSYYEGNEKDLYNKDIQDLFKINLLDINIPFLIKRKDITPSNK